MKIYRTIGTILSSILTFVLILVLVLSLTVLSVANAITKDTIASITKSIMQNDTIREEISVSLAAQMQTITSELVVTITKPSTETEKPGSPSDDTQGTTPGTTPTPGETPENPEDPPVEETKVIEIPAEHINEFLEMPEVQEAFSDIIAEYAMVIVEQNNAGTISGAARMEVMFRENPDSFNELVESFLPEYELTYDDFYNLAKGVAEESDVAFPDHGASYSEMLASFVSAKSEQIDRMIEDIIAEYLPDQTASMGTTPVMKVRRAMPLLTATSAPALDEADNTELQNYLAILSDALSILQNPKIYAALLALIIFFYLLTALLTWSLLRPTLFVGIALMASGALLLTVSNLPIPFDFLASTISDALGAQNAVASIQETLVITWNAIEKIILSHALVVIAIGVILLAVFITLSIAASMKSKTAKAEVNEEPKEESPMPVLPEEPKPVFEEIEKEEEIITEEETEDEFPTPTPEANAGILAPTEETKEEIPTPAETETDTTALPESNE